MSTVAKWQVAASTLFPMASGRSIRVQLQRGRSPSCAPAALGRGAADGVRVAVIALLLAPFPRGEKREVPECEGASPTRSAGDPGVWGYDGEAGGGITPRSPLEAADPGEDVPREGEDCCVRARIWFSRLWPDRADRGSGVPVPAPGPDGDRSRSDAILPSDGGEVLLDFFSGISEQRTKWTPIFKVAVKLHFSAKVDSSKVVQRMNSRSVTHRGRSCLLLFASKL